MEKISKEEKLKQFRFRLRSMGNISHHDIQWKEIFELYGLKWEN